MNRQHEKFSSSQLIILGFAGVIIMGCLLLMLPISSKSGAWTDWSDALFTSTSAVCVTGLVVQDTASYWSDFGQLIILLLIQTGGMGVVTLAIALPMVRGKKIGLRQRSTMQEAISAPQVGGIIRLTGFIIKLTLAFEAIGALIMAPVFCKRFGFIRGIWYSIFHAISAFCNAGFDLMGLEEDFSSLTSFVTNPVINMVIMSLIIIGGIGFMVWDDIYRNRLNVHRYRMQTKLVLTTTFFLILLPALYFFYHEFSDEPMAVRFWSSLFQAVTPRTAGFNTADQGLLSSNGVLITIVLMLVGGSPGSTAGGMKTTTFAVMMANSLSVFRRREHTCFFGRRVSGDVVTSAATIFTMYIILFMTGGCVISALDGLPLKECLFETASAIGTVGLTLGITTKVSVFSRMILIGLMYFGRVGGLTLIFAALSKKGDATSRLPQEKLTVG